jgi:hypothetical protein
MRRSASGACQRRSPARPHPKQVQASLCACTDGAMQHRLAATLGEACAGWRHISSQRARGTASHGCSLAAAKASRRLESAAHAVPLLAAGKAKQQRCMLVYEHWQQVRGRHRNAWSRFGHAASMDAPCQALICTVVQQSAAATRMAWLCGALRPPADPEPGAGRGRARAPARCCAASR